MSRTLIQLVGESLDIEDLRHFLIESPWQIIQESDGYYLSSSILDSIDKAEAIAIANELLELLNGFANVIHYNHRYVSIGALTIIDDNGKKVHYVTIVESAEARDRINVTLNLLGNPSHNTTSTSKEWMLKAYVHPSVKDAIHFFNDKSWSGLYKIFEIIREDVNGEENLSKIVPKDKIDSFRQTAQSRDAIGDKARHGKKIPAPKSPMSFEDANGFIRSLFESWVNSK